MNVTDEELYSLIEKYEKSINAAWHLTPPDIDDAMNTAYERDEIHEALERLNAEHVNVDLTVLRLLDEKWQDQLLDYIKSGEVSEPFYPMPNIPNSKWWMHIESLDSLTKQELECL